MPEEFAPHFAATGIGSLPHLDPVQAVHDVLERLVEMPYWPQLPRRSPLEDMNLQYAAALSPLVRADAAQRQALAHPGQTREEALAGLYERLMGGELLGFGLHPEEAAGFYEFLEVVSAANPESFPWVKGHVTGPLTQCAAVMGADGKALLYDDELAEAVARGLGAAGAAQVEQLAPLGRRVLLFVDEPFLSGYGSAFTPVNHDQVLTLLRATLEELRSRAPGVVVGVHCCGNTEWSLLIEADFDVINLDSAGYGQGILLYPDAVRELLERGGAVAWGAVPASEFTGQETAQGLWHDLRGLLEALEGKGIAREVLARQSLVTPACGLGSLNQEKALRILGLTAAVSRLAREEYA